MTYHKSINNCSNVVSELKLHFFIGLIIEFVKCKIINYCVKILYSYLFKEGMSLYSQYTAFYGLGIK